MQDSLEVVTWMVPRTDGAGVTDPNQPYHVVLGGMMDTLTECITSNLKQEAWGEVWIELRAYQGEVSKALVHVVASRCSAAYQRAHYYRYTRVTKEWVRKTSIGVSHLRWVADKPIYHLFEVRDELLAWEKHMTQMQWAGVVQRSHGLAPKGMSLGARRRQRSRARMKESKQ